MDIRNGIAADAPACRTILESLPEWFGIPDAIDDYVAGLASTWFAVATVGDDVIGFIAVKDHSDDAAEITVAAVAPAHRKEGVGRELVHAADDYCRKTGRQYLQVKTVSPERESAPYEETRAFWTACGFRALETFPTLWDPVNPALQMIKCVPSRTAQTQIDALQLTPHPEGGHFRETWRSARQLELDDYEGPRSAGTSILFLLPQGDQSSWHTVRSDELWFWQDGDPLDLTICTDDTKVVRLGPGNPQAVVPAGAWQRAEPSSDVDTNGYTLVGCVVVPGFDFADFELSDPPEFGSTGRTDG